MGQGRRRPGVGSGKERESIPAPGALRERGKSYKPGSYKDPAEATAGWAVRACSSARPRAENPLFAACFSRKRSFPIDFPLLVLIGAATLLSRIFIFPLKFWATADVFKKDPCFLLS